MLEGVETLEEKGLIARWLEQLRVSDLAEQRDLDKWTQRSKQELQKMITPPSTAKRPAKNVAWIASAAAILLFVSTGLLIWFYNNQPAKKNLQPLVYNEYRTVAGQRKLLVLSDGSRIWLGNASKIRYPKDFQNNKRDVFLDGQAFFEVSPDAERPFHVHVGELDVKVLGTSFDVENYVTDKEQMITVVSGKVSVQAKHKNNQYWILENRGQVVYNPIEKRGYKREVDVADVVSRRNGELVLNNEALKSIAVELERWYGVEIEVVSPALNSKRLSLSVKDDPLQRVLNMLSIAGDFRFEIQGKHIKLYKERGTHDIVIITTRFLTIK